MGLQQEVQDSPWQKFWVSSLVTIGEPIVKIFPGRASPVCSDSGTQKRWLEWESKIQPSVSIFELGVKEEI
jgi:hypothetical protein